MADVVKSFGFWCVQISEALRLRFFVQCSAGLSDGFESKNLMACTCDEYVFCSIGLSTFLRKKQKLK